MRSLNSAVTMCALDADRAASVAVTVLCVGRALGDLAVCWRDAPMERQIGWAFLLWLIPSAWGLMARDVVISRPLLAVGTVCALGAHTTDLHVFGHAGMAAALAAWLPVRAARCRHRAAFWRISAFAWMPVSGWLMTMLPVGSSLSLPAYAGMRVAWAAAAAVLLLTTILPRGLFGSGQKERIAKERIANDRF